MLENITKIEELFDLFNLNAKDHPETLALKSHDGTFTYSELVTAIDRASSCMIEQNCVPGDFIGCSLEAGSQKLIILLAKAFLVCFSVSNDLEPCTKYPGSELAI